MPLAPNEVFMTAILLDFADIANIIIAVVMADLITAAIKHVAYRL